MTLRDQVRIGVEAQSLIENETMVRAFRQVEDKLIGLWISSDGEDLEGRELTYHRLQALYWLQRELKILLDNGNIAARTLEKEK
jgi:hypothetical protein